MPDYRLYFLSSEGRVAHAVELQCRDDENAIEMAESQADGRGMELWCLERRVKIFPAENRT
jgi:hypothetical protein